MLTLNVAEQAEKKRVNEDKTAKNDVVVEEEERELKEQLEKTKAAKRHASTAQPHRQTSDAAH